MGWAPGGNTAELWQRVIVGEGSRAGGCRVAWLAARNAVKARADQRMIKARGRPERFASEPDA
jgi:hypothetical protein